MRSWRERVTPAAVGLPIGGRRRAAGLRREELAALAGISVDYLTRLEQGRATSPSAQVIEALARALRLSDPERELLFRLAGQEAPGREVVSQRIPPSVQRLLDRFSSTPVAVYDATWDLIDTNAPYEALTGASAWRGIERNGVWRNFVGPGPVAVTTPEQLAEQQEGLVGRAAHDGGEISVRSARAAARRGAATAQPALRRAVGVGRSATAGGPVAAQVLRSSGGRPDRPGLRHSDRRRR